MLTKSKQSQEQCGSLELFLSLEGDLNKRIGLNAKRVKNNIIIKMFLPPCRVKTPYYLWPLELKQSSNVCVFVCTVSKILYYNLVSYPEIV